MTYKETHQFYTNIRGFYCAVFCRIFCSILGSSFDIGSEGNDMSKLQETVTFFLTKQRRFIMKAMKKIVAILVALVFAISTGTVAFAGDPNGPSPYSIFGPLKDDDRYKVDSTANPYLAVCKLIITYDDKSTAGGTGFLISPTKIVTAAHCLDLKSKPDSEGNIKYNRKAKSIEILFGASGSNTSHTAKYSRTISCTSENTIVNDNWQRNNTSYDYGLIILPDKDKVVLNSYFKLYSETTDNLKTISAGIVGYEHCLYNTKFTNYQLIRGDGTIGSVNSYKLHTRIGGMPGQSGGPVLDGNNRVVGIYTYGANKGDIIEGTLTDSDWNIATRITKSVIDFYDDY
jgi:V8-like Glu-specific endopeptidase